ncbi:hypothetical protein K2P97_03010 [bacterium]|nr:hypothetical protein [bacterium]
MNFLIVAAIILSFAHSEARIRLRKVKEAPKACVTMKEDNFLSRKDKKVLGTLRHSILIEKNNEEPSITLVKDKGEKICQWTLDKWSSIEINNKLPNTEAFKFHIDEYKEVLYPYVQKDDKSYFIMEISFKDCSLDTQITKASLDLPKCENPKKSRKPSSKKKSRTKKV